jgi:hypothetical protein
MRPSSHSKANPKPPKGKGKANYAAPFLKLGDPFGWPSGGSVLYLELSYALTAFDLAPFERDAFRHGCLFLAVG